MRPWLLPLLLSLSLGCRTDGDKDIDAVEETPVDTDLADADGDGFTVATDCNDTDPAVFPGADELCNGLDDDCDTDIDEGVLQTYFRDADGDGFGDPSAPIEACEPPDDAVLDGNDCDDTTAASNPAAPERCDGLDNDCDAEVDEDLTERWYADLDLDGYGDGSAAVDDCDPPEGYVADATDCDDLEALANPGATEVCDGLDNDCDVAIDEEVTTTFYADLDGDGYGGAIDVEACAVPPDHVSRSGDCDDTAPSVNPDGTELCNRVDDDCDGEIDLDAADADTWFFDEDGDGFGLAGTEIESCTAPADHVALGTDCDDGTELAAPGLDEVCDGLDNDCDGEVDEPSSVDALTWYADGDGDGFGTAGSATVACYLPMGFSAVATDCDDGEARSNPDGVEVCDGLDNDCDGQVDPGLTTTFFGDGDGDGYGSDAVTLRACSLPTGFAVQGGDCDDTDDAVNPDALEVCNELDDDCDGGTDVGLTVTVYEDHDGDGFGEATRTAERCAAGDGYVADATDCDDDEASVNPDGTEVCNGVDDDCDEVADEGVQSIFYVDGDGDGFGHSGVSLAGCSAPAGFVSDGRDCADGDSAINPDALEVCNGLDDDCDGRIDPGLTTDFYADVDGDGFGDPEAVTAACAQPGGTVANGGDCDDSTGDIRPGAPEVCDGEDDDCDGIEDNGVTDGSIFYEDADGDGLGNADSTLTACEAPVGYVDNTLDCDDSSGSISFCGSCLEILDGGRSRGDGVYELDPCGRGTLQEYWCDMTTDGGGWTVAGWQDADATTDMGLSNAGIVGGDSWSVDLACVAYDEVFVFNATHGLHFQQSYTPSVWTETAVNLAIGGTGTAFKHGTYGPAASLIMMGCVDYSHTGGLHTSWACDSDGQRSAKGHLADYAGEYCVGARLDYTWAWSDGNTCSLRGSMYTWGYGIR